MTKIVKVKYGSQKFKVKLNFGFCFEPEMIVYKKVDGKYKKVFKECDSNIGNLFDKLGDSSYYAILNLALEKIIKEKK